MNNEKKLCPLGIRIEILQNHFSLNNRQLANKLGLSDSYITELKKGSIDRTWSDHDNEYGYVLVTYVNDTGKIFETAVTIKCVALDAAGNRLGVNTRSFFEHEYGPIVPGFEDTVEIPIKLHGKIMSGVKCKCLEK